MNEAFLTEKINRKRKQKGIKNPGQLRLPGVCFL